MNRSQLPADPSDLSSCKEERGKKILIEHYEKRGKRTSPLLVEGEQTAFLDASLIKSGDRLERRAMSRESEAGERENGPSHSIGRHEEQEQLQKYGCSSHTSPYEAAIADITRRPFFFISNHCLIDSVSLGM